MPARRWLRCLCLLWALLAAPAALAQPEEPGAFDQHIARAEEFFAGQRYAEAIGELKAAQAIRPDRGILLNLGHAYRRLGRPESALAYYQRFLDEGPPLDPADRGAVEQYMAQARLLLQPRPVAGPAPAQPDLLLRRPPPVPRPVVPLYRRWWFWGLVGVAAAGVVTAAVLTTQPWDAGVPPQQVPIHDARF